MRLCIFLALASLMASTHAEAAPFDVARCSGGDAPFFRSGHVEGAVSDAAGARIGGVRIESLPPGELALMLHQGPLALIGTA